MADDPGYTTRVRRLFAETLNVDVPSEDTDLIESGVLDSLALVELLFAIEREFSITLPFDELDIENFRSVRTISESVASTNGTPG